MTHDDERIIREASSIKNTKGRNRLKLIGLLVLVCLLAVVAGSASTYFSLKNAAEDGTELAQQVQAACDLPGDKDPQLAQFCPKADQVVNDAPDTVKADPVPGPPGDPGPTGATGATGASGQDAPPLTEDQILDALRLFCANTGKCRGADGADATATQVAIAVSSYCNRRGECRGPAGVAGQNGTNGTNGTDGQDGVDGQPATQGQIIAAVDDYCSANNGCRGPAGADGQNGGQGPAGPPGVVNVIDDCGAAPDGQVIADVNPTYDSESQTVTVTCSYKDDQSGILPENP